MLPKQIKDLADSLAKLPEIGPRAALRLVFFLLEQKQEELDKIASQLKELKKVKICYQCHNLASENLCAICSDNKRNKEQILVVESILDILPIERTKQYRGLYHILGGTLNPLDDIGPEKLKIKDLLERINKLKKDYKKEIEVIFALNPSTEGDATTQYVLRQVKLLEIKTSRLGRGLSSGSSLEYSDESTITEAIKSRK